jgi:Ran GTPase-activating protein (RanGAP) involved in mRNA processing and transport
MLDVGDTEGVLDMETGDADTDGGNELEADDDAECADGVIEAVVEIDGVLLAVMLRVAVTVGVGATLLVGV